MTRAKDISIRKFRPSDLSAVKNLIHNTIDVCYSATYPKEAIKFFKVYHCEESILKGAEEGHAIVLEQDDRIVGTGSIVDDHIVRVFVEPKYQKLGFGKLIMRKLEAKASWQGINVVNLDASLPSKKFYDLLGYITLEETFLEVENGKRLDYYKMEKPLERVT
jgi:GNAT superfamily N-acetyltransferase